MSLKLEKTAAGSTLPDVTSEDAQPWRPDFNITGGFGSPLFKRIQADRALIAEHAMEQAQRHPGIVATRSSDLQTGTFRIGGVDGEYQSVTMNGRDGMVRVKNENLQTETVMKFDSSGKLNGYVCGGGDQPPVRNADGSYTLNSGRTQVRVASNPFGSGVLGELQVQVTKDGHAAQAGLTIAHVGAGDASAHNVIGPNVDLPQSMARADYMLVASGSKDTGHVSVIGADYYPRFGVAINAANGEISFVDHDLSMPDVLKLDPATGQVTLAQGDDTLRRNEDGSYSFLRGDTEIDIGKNHVGSQVKGDYVVHVRNAFDPNLSKDIGVTIDAKTGMVDVHDDGEAGLIGGKSLQS